MNGRLLSSWQDERLLSSQIFFHSRAHILSHRADILSRRPSTESVLWCQILNDARFFSVEVQAPQQNNTTTNSTVTLQPGSQHNNTQQTSLFHSSQRH